MVTYCIVPRDLAVALHPLLHDHFRRDDSVRVIVERRVRERRRESRRRSGVQTEGRRRIRNEAGRRVAEQRATTVPVEAPPLPARARRYADRLTFVERVEPTERQVSDVESTRLAIRVQAGDYAATHELYMRHFEEVFTYARTALRSAHEAEEVAQQVFLSVIESLPRHEVRSFRPWLFAIARNAVVDKVRQRARLSLEDPGVIDAQRDSLLSDEVASRLSWITDPELSLFVERLPQAQREALVLRYLLDLNTEEIGMAMGRTPKAAESLLNRALRTLEEHLVAVGRRADRRRRAPMRIRVRPAPVMVRRRFALGFPAREAGRARLRAAYRRGTRW